MKNMLDQTLMIPLGDYSEYFQLVLHFNIMKSVYFIS